MTAATTARREFEFTLYTKAAGETDELP
eukprot:COSAG02_NODE_30195_length_555_cov_1.508772_1_plen_27_part_10